MNFAENEKLITRFGVCVVNNSVLDYIIAFSILY